MKFFLAAILAMTFIGCTTVKAVVKISAAKGIVMCPKLGVVPFEGDVILSGNWAVFTPVDQGPIRGLAATNCIVTVIDEESN